jgi:hypothetical protein
MIKLRRESKRNRARRTLFAVGAVGAVGAAAEGVRRWRHRHRPEHSES